MLQDCKLFKNSMTMREEWRDIVGYEGLYKVSNFGRVLSLPKNRFKSTRLRALVSDKNGYKEVGLSKDKKVSTKKVHRLVAEAFIPKVEGKNLINHKNGQKDDNRVENLEWCTLQENATHAKETLNVKRRGGRKVCQYTLDGYFVRRYETVAEAARNVGTTTSAIVLCLKRKSKTSKGYQWTYIEDYKERIEPYKSNRDKRFSKVLTYANASRKRENISQGEALRKAWKKIKNKEQ